MIKFQESLFPISLLANIYEDDTHKNVEITCSDDKVVWAHSCILIAASTNIRTILSWSSFGCYKLKVNNITSQQWQWILQILYTGQISLPDEKSLTLLIEAWEWLGVDNNTILEKMKILKEKGWSLEVFSVGPRPDGFGQSLPGQEVEQVTIPDEGPPEPAQITISDNDQVENDQVEKVEKDQTEDDGTVNLCSHSKLDNGVSKKIKSKKRRCPSKRPVTKKRKEVAKSVCKTVKNGNSKNKGSFKGKGIPAIYDNMSKNCKKCGRVFETFRATVSHYKRFHKLSRCYICKKCGLGYKTLQYLNDVHVKRTCLKRSRRKSFVRPPPRIQRTVTSSDSCSESSDDDLSAPRKPSTLLKSMRELRIVLHRIDACSMHTVSSSTKGHEQNLNDYIDIDDSDDKSYKDQSSKEHKDCFLTKEDLDRTKTSSYRYRDEPVIYISDSDSIDLTEF